MFTINNNYFIFLVNSTQYTLQLCFGLQKAPVKNIWLLSCRTLCYVHQLVAHCERK